MLNGVLVFVIPFDQLNVCVHTLSGNFAQIAAFRLSDPESIRFRQIVVFGVRRNVRGGALEANRKQVLHLAERDGYSMLPTLKRGLVASYHVPESSEAALTYRGLHYDLLEDLLPQSAAWKQASAILLKREDVATGRPITPLHGGHVGLLCTAGLLNGTFGEGEERHIARWRSVKHVIEFKEEDGDTITVHRREKWSNELRLIYVTGKAMKLTETAQGESNGECTPEDGSP
jgi:hypothetical protein